MTLRLTGSRGCTCSDNRMTEGGVPHVACDSCSGSAAFRVREKEADPVVKKHLLPKRMRLLREVTDWNSEHLCYQQKDGIPMRCYRSDSGNAFALGSRADEIYALAARAAMLVQMFRERRISRRAMPRLLRKDPLLG